MRQMKPLSRAPPSSGRIPFAATGTVRHGGGQVNVKMRWRATSAFRVHIPGVHEFATPLPRSVSSHVTGHDRNPILNDQGHDNVLPVQGCTTHYNLGGGNISVRCNGGMMICEVKYEPSDGPAPVPLHPSWISNAITRELNSRLCNEKSHLSTLKPSNFLTLQHAKCRVRDKAPN